MVCPTQLRGRRIAGRKGGWGTLNSIVQFQCNICKAANEFQPTGFGRDDASCATCGSTLRLRALLHALSVEIFGMPLALADFPPMKSIRGLGMTDQMECASLLESRFDYRNTFYHEVPRFDVSQPPEECEIFDFILAGDIFEHVAPPVEQPLANACALLKPHGFLAMTVPYLPAETTEEHFAELHEFNLVTAGGHLALVWSSPPPSIRHSESSTANRGRCR
jgi:hypothetical protein